MTESRRDLVAAYGRMRTIRRFEERVLELRLSDDIAGSLHLCGGQEAIPVGALAVIEPVDRVIATYRGHGWAAACGISIRTLFAEILGRASGTNGGRAGSAYLMAVARKLPVIFVCENNRFAEMTPIAAITPVSNLADRAPAYGMPGATIDGNDPESVADAIADAADRARISGGPTFLECKTVRLMAHFHADIEQTLVTLEEAVAADVQAAAEHALAEPVPDPATAASHVFLPARRPAACCAGATGSTFPIAGYDRRRRSYTRHGLTYGVGRPLHRTALARMVHVHMTPRSRRSIKTPKTTQRPLGGATRGG